MRAKLLLILCVFLSFIFLFSAHSAIADYRTNSNTVIIRVGNPLDIGGTCWPTNGSLTQGPLGRSSHAGIQVFGGDSLDIGNTLGTPVYATFDGNVKVYDCIGKGICDGGYGNLVKLIPSSNSSAILYFAHLSQINVLDGSKVTKGAKIGLSGTTGNSTGVHLHYEFRGGGMKMAPPNIPQAITPLNCDTPSIGCSPYAVSSDPKLCAATSITTEYYWFILHRQSNTEELYKGTPGDKGKSSLIRTYKVRTGKPGERPTPLPKLVGKDYWLIESKRSSSGITGPYFLKLNIPYNNKEPFGPEPYLECGGKQCNWQTPGDFGLHGTGGDRTRVDNDGSQDIHWSSGCIRHFDSDITDLYNLLDPTKGEIRYYIEDN